MGLFNFFKKPVILHDDFFGELRLEKSKNASDNYFTGKVYFAPTSSDVHLSINTDQDHPANEQKKFYADLQTCFAQYIVKMTPLIEDEFRNWKEDFAIKDFTSEFKLEFITIPLSTVKPLVWEMSFSTIHDLDHQVTIHFIDHEPESILIDG